MKRLAIVVGLLLPAAAQADEAPPAEDMDTSYGLLREPAVSFSPRFSPLGSSPTNREITVGFSFTAQPKSWIGIEANVSVYPLSGVGNITDTSLTTVLLTGDRIGLESVDRLATFTVGPMLVPVSGYLAPPGLAGAHLEMLFGFGAGVEVAQLESITADDDAAAFVTDPVLHARPVLTTLAGFRLAPTPIVAFRFDARVTGGIERMLDFTTDESATINRSLPEGATTTRALCADETSEAICRVGGWHAFTLEFAAEFTIGARTVTSR